MRVVVVLWLAVMLVWGMGLLVEYLGGSRGDVIFFSLLVGWVGFFTPFVVTYLFDKSGD